MPDPSISNPLGVDVAQGNQVYVAKVLASVAADVQSNLKSVSTISTATPAVVTTTAAHGYVTGQSVGITGVVGTGAAFPAGQPGPGGLKNQFVVTVLTATTFSIGVGYAGTYTSGGTVVGANQVGQLMAWNSWNGLVSGGAGTPAYPTVTLNNLAAAVNFMGVVEGPNTGGGIIRPGGVLLVCTAGFSRGLFNVTTTQPTNVLAATSVPGQLIVGTAASSLNIGDTLQVVTGTIAAPLLASMIVKFS
jgi:hypothetical protein